MVEPALGGRTVCWGFFFYITCKLLQSGESPSLPVWHGLQNKVLRFTPNFSSHDPLLSLPTRWDSQRVKMEAAAAGHMPDNTCAFARACALAHTHTCRHVCAAVGKWEGGGGWVRQRAVPSPITIMPSTFPYPSHARSLPPSASPSPRRSGCVRAGGVCHITATALAHVVWRYARVGGRGHGRLHNVRLGWEPSRKCCRRVTIWWARSGWGSKRKGARLPAAHSRSLAPGGEGTSGQNDSQRPLVYFCGAKVTADSLTAHEWINLCFSCTEQKGSGYYIYCCYVEISVVLFGPKVAEKHAVISESMQAEHLEMCCSFKKNK